MNNMSLKLNGFIIRGIRFTSIIIASIFIKRQIVRVS